MDSAEQIYDKLMAGETRNYNIRIIEDSLHEYTLYIRRLVTEIKELKEDIEKTKNR